MSDLERNYTSTAKSVINNNFDELNAPCEFVLCSERALCLYQQVQLVSHLMDLGLSGAVT